MRVNGLKNLKSNFYDFIMIRNKGYEVIIDVKRKDKIKTIKTDNEFKFENTGATHKKIESIIRYFLNNNKIMCIDNKKHIDRYNGIFISIEGSRNLYLQITSNFVDVKSLTKDVFNKYQLDRNEFLYDNKDIKNIEIFLDDGSSRYEVYNDDKEEILSLRLLSKLNFNNSNMDISNFEKKFIIKYIQDKLNELDEEVVIDVKGLIQKVFLYDDLSFGDLPGNYIVSSRFKINISEHLLFLVLPLIKEHNEKIKNTKKLQLTFNDINN